MKVKLAMLVEVKKEVKVDNTSRLLTSNTIVQREALNFQPATLV